MQAAVGPPSSEHQAVAVGSSTVKSTVALVLLVTCAGTVTRVTVGAVELTVKVFDAVAPVLPAGSTAYTATVCGPSLGC